MISVYELGTSDDVEMITYYHLWSDTQHDPDEVRRLMEHAKRLKPSKATELGDEPSGDEKVSKFFREHGLHPFAVHDLRDDVDPPPIPGEYLNNRLRHHIEVWPMATYSPKAVNALCAIFAGRGTEEDAELFSSEHEVVVGAQAAEWQRLNGPVDVGDMIPVNLIIACAEAGQIRLIEQRGEGGGCYARRPGLGLNVSNTGTVSMGRSYDEEETPLPLAAWFDRVLAGGSSSRRIVGQIDPQDVERLMAHAARRVCFWVHMSAIDMADGLIRQGWSESPEGQAVISYMTAGREIEAYRSIWDLCPLCNENLLSDHLVLSPDGHWVYPAGATHLIRVHSLAPTNERFVADAMAWPPDQP